jgi:hypothetical protein
VLLLATSSSALTISARLIQASENDPEKVDPALSDIESRLKNTFKYKQYVLLSRSQGEVTKEKPLKLNLGSGLTLEVTLISEERDKSEVSIRWSRSSSRGQEDLMRFTRVLSPGDIQILGGPKSDGGVLILAIKAE